MPYGLHPLPASAQPHMWKSWTLTQSHGSIWGGNFYLGFLHLQIDRKEATATMVMFCTSSFVNEVQVQGYQALIKSTNLYCKREHQRLDTEQSLGFDWSRSKNLCTALPLPSSCSLSCRGKVRGRALLPSKHSGFRGHSCKNTIRMMVAKMAE